MEQLVKLKSFLSTTKVILTQKAFIHSFMECCSPLWAGSPASHLAQVDAMETKSSKIIGISHDEAEFMGVSLCHCRRIGGLSVFYCLLSSLVPSALSVLCPRRVDMYVCMYVCMEYEESR